MIEVTTCSSCLHFDSYLLIVLEFSLQIIVHCIAAIIAENEHTPLANLPSDPRNIPDLDILQESDHEKGVPEFFPLFCISVGIHSSKMMLHIELLIMQCLYLEHVDINFSTKTKLNVRSGIIGHNCFYFLFLCLFWFKCHTALSV